MHTANAHDKPVPEVLDVLDVGGALEAGDADQVVAGDAANTIVWRAQ